MISLEEMLEAHLVMEYAKLAAKDHATNAVFQAYLPFLHRTYKLF